MAMSTWVRCGKITVNLANVSCVRWFPDSDKVRCSVWFCGDSDPLELTGVEAEELSETITLLECKSEKQWGRGAA